MSGNTLFLVCTPCHKDDMADYGIKLCARAKSGVYKPETPAHVLKVWLAKHSGCGGLHNPDHYQIAHLVTPNSDQRALATS